jgi:hypothetical protein
MNGRSSTETLANTMRILANQIEGGDGTANAAMFEAADRLVELRRLIELAEPIVWAQHGAEHMLDGFKLKPRPAIDSLLESLQRELAN